MPLQYDTFVLISASDLLQAPKENSATTTPHEISKPVSSPNTHSSPCESPEHVIYASTVFGISCGEDVYLFNGLCTQLSRVCS